MNRKRPLAGADGEVRELNPAEIRAMRPMEEVLPPDLAGIIRARKPGERGPQKAPVKRQVTLRLDVEVVEKFRATGKGWPSRINAILVRTKIE